MSPVNDKAAGQRILVGVDGSAASIEALEWAARQAESTGGVLRVVLTWDWPTSYGWGFALPGDYDPAADAGKLLDETVAGVRSAHPNVELQAVVIQGHPAPALVDESGEADLLVVGSRGHGEFAGMLIGSVSEHCVSNAKCPVVVVRGRPHPA